MPRAWPPSTKNGLPASPEIDPLARLETDARIAVIGAGTMGAGIAQVAALAGHEVLLHDARGGAAAEAAERIRGQLAGLAAKGRLDNGLAQAAGARVSIADSLEALAPAALAIEAIVEQLEAKQALFRRLETILASDSLLASNTSSIPITAIGAALAHPGRLAGMHFFNPAPRMQLVEIVSGLDTDAATAATLHDTAAAWGKTPVHTRSTPGFIVNRVARPYYAEGLRLLLEQAGDPATLDHILRASGGFRMGPFELMDLIGHDVNFAVTCSVWNAFYQDPRFQPSLVQQELVDAGRLGRKTGQGFHDYRPQAQGPTPRLEAVRAAPADITLHGDSPAAQALADRLQARGITHRRAAAAPDQRIAGIGRAALYLTDGRTATRRAADNGQADTVLLDLALDFARASCVAIAAARQAGADAVTDAVGLLQAAGHEVARIGDVPGMLVMRTVAMLANEAADAVNQGVCTAQAVDQAMRLGVNYPLGPLEWADRLGAASIGTVLNHVAAAYGEDRYRLSPLIQHAIHSARPIHD